MLFDFGLNIRDMLDALAAVMTKFTNVSVLIVSPVYTEFVGVQTLSATSVTNKGSRDKPAVLQIAISRAVFPAHF